MNFKLWTSLDKFLMLVVNPCKYKVILNYKIYGIYYLNTQLFIKKIR